MQLHVFEEKIAGNKLRVIIRSGSDVYSVYAPGFRIKAIAGGYKAELTGLKSAPFQTIFYGDILAKDKEKEIEKIKKVVVSFTNSHVMSGEHYTIEL